MKNLTKHIKSPVGVILTLIGLMGIAALREPSALAQPAASASWTFTGSLNAVRTGHTATLLPNGKVLVAGGYDSHTVLKSAELYDSATGTWGFTGNLNTARRGHTATLEIGKPPDTTQEWGTGDRDPFGADQWRTLG